MDHGSSPQHDYRALLRAIVEESAAEPVEGGEGIEDFTICDDTSGNYLLYSSGWQGHERTYGAVIHLRIKGEQVIVEANWTDDDVVERLIDGGVPREAIVLGWVQPGIPTAI